eukprot:IDg13114t1
MRFEPCQPIRLGPVRLRVSFGAENALFNERVLIDIMYIGVKPVIHIADEGMHYSAASFLQHISVEVIWVESTRIEPYNSLGIGECYHQPLRTTLRKMRKMPHSTTRANSTALCLGYERYVQTR